MSYLVDGNNVMGQRVGWHRDKPGARRRLLSELAGFARAAGVTVEVVFDGAPDEFFPDGAEFCGVRLFYAARGSDADARIKQATDQGIVPGPRMLVTTRAIVATGSYGPKGFTPEFAVPQGAEEYLQKKI